VVKASTGTEKTQHINVRDKHPWPQLDPGNKAANTYALDRGKYKAAVNKANQ
jgi:hypothetical protein